MESSKILEAWDLISRWYQQVKVPQPPLSMEALDQVSMKRAELYICIPPEGLQVPFLVQLVDIEDDVPTKAEITVAVWCLRGGREGGAQDMHVEDLKG